MKRIILLSVILVIANADELTSVETKQGVINGKVVGHSFRGQDYTTQRFLGIPYAKPPTGQLRFKKPQPYDTFTESFDAFEFGSGCPQNDMKNLGTPSNNEDCLTLNVYVPQRSTDTAGKLAVMIFIHGGGFAIGASSLVPGHVLSAYGNIVLVSINYRLGIFGFANTGDDNAKGNMGLWDQRLAFQWVNENIAAFGGDPSRITIFGESAGSMSVFMQSMYPENKGLFQNIIGESGTSTMPFGALKDTSVALTTVAEMLECPTETMELIFNCLNAKDATTIMAVFKDNTDMEKLMKLQFMPTIDGEYFKRSPLETLALSKDTPTEEVKFLRSLNAINGMNNAEGAMWVPFFIQGDLEDISVSHDEMKNVHIKTALHLAMMGKPVPELLSSIVASEYTNWANLSEARNMYVKLMGDLYFNVPGYEMTLLLSNSSDSEVWMYNFEAQLQNHLLETPSWAQGANHADELMPVFGYGVTEYGLLANHPNINPPEWELDLAETMMTFWSNFATYG